MTMRERRDDRREKIQRQQQGDRGERTMTMTGERRYKDDNKATEERER